MQGTPKGKTGTIIGWLCVAIVAGPAATGDALAQVGLPSLDGPLTKPVDPALERVDDRVESRLERRRKELEEKAGEAVADESAPGAADAIDEAASGAVETGAETIENAADTVTRVVGNTEQSVSGTVARTLRPFALAADPAGWPIEQDIVVMLIDESEAEALSAQGLEIAARRRLPALGLVMITLRKPAGAELGAVIADLRAAQPDTVVDYNHVYRLQSDAQPTARTGSPPAARDTGRGSIRVGMIDSAVKADHAALRDSTVVSEDFVTNEGRRPLTHGTAVASLIARSSASEAEIFSASVFFQAPGYAPGATTESLVAALDWLATVRVHAINMSLAGPGNALLEKAVDAILEEGPPIVAAVGNNGPSGEPLYPAAYADVIGITAVDREGEVFLYANRGEHVDYAALGVNVKVADSEGSWTLQSGTSMASPHVAVVVARMLQPGHPGLEALAAALTASAEDLGRKGFDSTFGHGLIGDAPVLVSRQDGAQRRQGDPP